jgi:putative transposase
MEIVDPATGQVHIEKRRRRFNEAGEPRELTFSSYRGYPFLSRDRTREWFRDALEAARQKFAFQLWAYVIMPEHVHLLVVPRLPRVARPESSKGVQTASSFTTHAEALKQADLATGISARPSKTQGVPPMVSSLVGPNQNGDSEMSRFLQALKEPIARKAIAYLREISPSWLGRLQVQEGQRIRHRFWQPGGGYDRNVLQTYTLRSMIEYIHNNPVRRGLVGKAEDWEWSSARWFMGLRPVKIEMDAQVLAELT